MEAYVSFLNRVIREEEGQDMVEYALLVGLISVAAIAALLLARDAINALWDAVTAALDSATAVLLVHGGRCAAESSRFERPGSAGHRSNRPRFLDIPVNCSRSID
jgi:pilus assembly protein Flp/PilA